jgi:hypothetical protein
MAADRCFAAEQSKGAVSLMGRSLATEAGDDLTSDYLSL